MPVRFPVLLGLRRKGSSTARRWRSDGGIQSFQGRRQLTAGGALAISAIQEDACHDRHGAGGDDDSLSHSLSVMRHIVDGPAHGLGELVALQVLASDLLFHRFSGRGIICKSVLGARELKKEVRSVEPGPGTSRNVIALASVAAG